MDRCFLMTQNLALQLDQFLSFWSLKCEEHEKWGTPTAVKSNAGLPPRRNSTQLNATQLVMYWLTTQLNSTDSCGFQPVL